MKILYLSDNLDHWSCHNRCKALKEFLPDYQIDIKQGWGKERQFANIYHNYDIVHVHYTNRLHEFLPMIKQFPHKFVITIANERGLVDGYGIEKDKVIEMIESGLAHFTSLSKKLSGAYGIEYIPNGVDTRKFKEERQPVVGFVGTAKENKNYPLLKEVCEEMGVKLIACCYKQNQVPQEELYKYYKQMDLLIHPSKTEGCNNVILEALAMNVPVYMTRAGIWEDLIGWVRFIEPTEKGIRAVLNRYLARDFIKKEFNWHRVAERYKDVYNRAINKPR